MKIYWTDKIPGCLAILAQLPVWLIALILLLPTLFPYFEKALNFYLEWRKHEDEKSLKEKEIEKKTYQRRKPPS